MGSPGRHFHPPYLSLEVLALGLELLAVDLTPRVALAQDLERGVPGFRPSLTDEPADPEDEGDDPRAPEEEPEAHHPQPPAPPPPPHRVHPPGAGGPVLDPGRPEPRRQEEPHDVHKGTMSSTAAPAPTRRGSRRP